MDRLTQPYNPDALSSAASTHILLEYARSIDIPEARILQGTRLSAALCMLPDTLIRSWQEVQLIENLLSVTGDAFQTGFQVGHRYRLSSYGMWGLGMLTSPTLNDAVALGIEFLQTASHFNHVCKEFRQGKVNIILDDRHLPAAIQPFLTGRDLSSIAIMLSELLPGLSIPMIGLRLAMPKRPLPPGFELIYPVNIEWNAPCHAILAEEWIMAAPLPNANAITHTLCRNQCIKQLALLRQMEGVRGRIKQLLVNQLQSSPSMESIAGQLNVTPRTLRRQLESEGCTWRDIKNEVRLEMAERLLNNSALSIQEIASQLGYSDISAFSHAFKRQKQTSPDHFRRQVG
ncbi:MAG: AraC family transcriptional regulator ligand-binding domain-containing protein [Hahellaceae bacterium]|nr:AraC family transcriptional regulator ligand-binding domain-containing protein [Hahellaceae bacterium]